jgi:Methyltransferase domain
MSQWSLRYFRYDLFVALRDPFQRRMRARRMALFAATVAPRAGDLVLDLGGQPSTWQGFSPSLNVVILNLPGAAEDAENREHGMLLVEGDATATHLTDGSFDVVFANSVIEHVGGAEKRAAFAREVHRLGRAYWVQTPSIWFPVEAHTGMPFWWLLGGWIRAKLLERWRRILPAWTEMVAGTTVVSKGELQHLFADAEIITERFLGWPKSYIAVRAEPVTRRAAGHAQPPCP